MNVRIIIRLLILGTIPFYSACDRSIPDPVSPPDNDLVPETPFNLAAAVGDASVSLSWSVIDTLAQSGFYIYMADSNAVGYSRSGETTGLSFTLGDLQNGVRYFFRVSSVTASGFEGYKSDPVSAVPNLYAIVIDSGREFTSTRDVLLGLSAPEDTRLMQIASDSTFAGTAWENFSPLREYRLTTGDGLKTVYCRFRDAAGRTTFGYLSDTITLDTESHIDSITYSPVGAPFSPGDTVHFWLPAGEPDGGATVTIGDDIVSLALYDNGSRGDSQAGDGIYELAYVIAGNLDFENMTVYGNFVDRAGNIAAPAVAVIPMTVRRPPDPVTIFNVTPPDQYYDRLQLAWSGSNAPDFARYLIYRDTLPGVDSTDFLTEIISSRGVVTTTDLELQENTQYFYRIYVLDNTGLMSGSNEMSGTTNRNLPPEAVDLHNPVATPGRHDRLELTWSESEDNDFLRYELYRSDDFAVDSLDLLIFSSISETAFTDTGLTADSAYYYAVRTMDTAGNTAWSNTVSGRTNPDTPPLPVNLLPAFVEPDRYRDVPLEWSRSFEYDFQSYRLYRWREVSGRNDSTIVFLTTDIDATSFIDHPPFDIPEDTLNYWYVVHVHDMGGNSAGSDSIRVHLQDDVPPQVSGSVMPSDSSLIISWLASDIPDFTSYHLLRDVDSDSTGAITVYVTSNQEITVYTDETTLDDQTYFYWLDIFDARGNKSRSSIGSGSW